MNIKKIQRGEADFSIEYAKVLSDIKKVCKQIDEMEPPESIKTKYTCIKCGRNLISTQYDYSCPETECDFKIPKMICDKKITSSIVDVLYSGKSTDTLNFKKKDGTRFTAKLKLSKENGLRFDFSSGLSCPYCNKEIGINTKGYFCDCGLKIFKTIAGRTLSDNDVSILLEKNILPKYNKYKSKNGNLFSAYLVLVEENGEKITKFKFEND